MRNEDINEVKMAYNLDTNNAKIPQKSSLSTISCTLQTDSDDGVPQGGNIQKNKVQVTTNYIPPHIRKINEIKVLEK